MDCLTKDSFDTFKSQINPPESAMMVIKCFYEILGVKATKKNWTAPMNNPGALIEAVKNFPKDSMSLLTCSAIQKFSRHEYFNHKKMEKKSEAAAQICRWLVTLERYAEIKRILSANGFKFPKV